MSDNKRLCAALLHADSEDEIITLLKKHGYWDKPALWRHYGDVENNGSVYELYAWTCDGGCEASPG